MTTSPESADSDTDRQISDVTIALDLAIKVLEVGGYYANAETLRIVADRLEGDPATVLDGPLVVLHPGQHVVESRSPACGEAFLQGGPRGVLRIVSEVDDEWPQVVVVASNPQERTL